MRVRWVIEHGYDDRGGVFLALVNREGDEIMGAIWYPSEDVARKEAESEGPLTWKAAPTEWQPDTYLVSSYYEDEGWNRD